MNSLRFEIEVAQHENSVLKHKFRQRKHERRPDIIVWVHDAENCTLCRILAAALEHAE